MPSRTKTTKRNQNMPIKRRRGKPFDIARELYGGIICATTPCNPNGTNHILCQHVRSAKKGPVRPVRVKFEDEDQRAINIYPWENDSDESEREIRHAVHTPPRLRMVNSITEEDLWYIPYNPDRPNYQLQPDEIHTMGVARRDYTHYPRSWLQPLTKRIKLKTKITMCTDTKQEEHVLSVKLVDVVNPDANHMIEMVETRDMLCHMEIDMSMMPDGSYRIVGGGGHAFNSDVPTVPIRIGAMPAHALSRMEPGVLEQLRVQGYELS